MRWHTVLMRQWPYPDPVTRWPSPFPSASLSDTLRLLDSELAYLDLVGPVALHMVAWNVRTGRDGAPTWRTCTAHPGVAVSFVARESGTVVLRCDRFGSRRRGWLINLRAIALGLRQVRRTVEAGPMARDAAWLVTASATRLEGAR